MCSFDPEKVVLCHIRQLGISGMGIKAPDILGYWACGPCHDVLDGRTPMMMDPMLLKVYESKAVYETINTLVKEGKIKWNTVTCR